MRFILYSLRWQLSTPVLWLCIHWLPLSEWQQVVVANVIGACIFFFVDKLIFRGKSRRKLKESE